MRLQRWKWIKKTCIECSRQFDCKSTDRRTQWCPSCNEARKQHQDEGHKISHKLSKQARKREQPCEQCGAKGYEYHHIKRLADGGGHGTDNLIFLCRECHFKKHYEGDPRSYIHRFGIK